MCEDVLMGYWQGMGEEKVDVFVELLAEVFEPFSAEAIHEDDVMLHASEIPYQLIFPIKIVENMTTRS